MEFMLSGGTFINIKKRMGPNTEPWGTPDNTEAGSELTSSMTMFCVRPRQPSRDPLEDIISDIIILQLIR